MQTPQYSYAGRHAELYDLFYAEKPYREEVAFVNACLQTYGDGVKNVLELACGTGTHALLLEKFGYEITATDYSADMLRQAQKKRKEAHSQVDFRLQNMLELEVPKQPWDAVLCLFDSIGYVATNEAIMKVLSGVNRQLRPGGVFIFEFWHAGAMLRYFDPIHVRRFQTPTGEIERISETSIDCKESLCHVLYTINEINMDGTTQKTTETQINRFFLVQEMRLLLQLAKLSPLKWFAGYREDEQIDQSTWHILGVAQKDNPQ
jgi:ubiquinone/menaquinone biosynthesis C-methylase UbiE